MSIVIPLYLFAPIVLLAVVGLFCIAIVVWLARLIDKYEFERNEE